MKRWAAKLLSLVIIFVVSVTANVLPLRLSAYFHRKGVRGAKVLSCLMCFGGGVFFATYMLHLGPEVRLIMDEAVIKRYHINYPLAELLMVIGFFMMLFLEFAVTRCSHNGSDIHHKHAQELENKRNETTDTLIDLTKSQLKNDEPDENKADKAANSTSFAEGDNDSCCVEGEMKIITPSHVSSRSTRSLLLLLALSLHHIFEGMGIGLQHSQSSVWSLTIAIVSHEVVIAFSLGLQLIKFYSTKQVVLAAVLCNGMTPLGTAIGMILVETPSQETHVLTIANGILQALSTGVFIYVTFLEILQNELSHSEVDLTKLLSLLAGFVVLAVLVLFPEDGANTAEMGPIVGLLTNITKTGTR